jgi:hypothetical protein
MSLKSFSIYIYLSTLTKPLAEKGYYVLPVAVIDQFLKENGLPTPAEMNGGITTIDLGLLFLNAV